MKIYLLFPFLLPDLSGAMNKKSLLTLPLHLYSLSKISTGQTVTSCLNLTASFFVPTIEP